jgi:chromosome segregation ATPase
MTRQDQMNELEERLAQWNARIRQLESDRSHADAMGRRAFDAELVTLKEHADSVDGQLAQLRLSKAESWEDETLLTGINRAMDEIGQRLDRLFRGVESHL